MLFVAVVIPMFCTTGFALEETYQVEIFPEPEEFVSYGDSENSEEMNVLPFINEEDFTTDNLTPTPMIDGGYWHTVALRYNGTVFTWGSNWFGQLGNIDTFNRSLTPVQIHGLNNVIEVSAGGGHTVALENNGRVWAWGFNGGGHLGNGTTNNSSQPVQVHGLINITTLSAGTDHTLAIRNDGTVWAWGGNWASQLGDGSNINRHTPVKIQSLSNIIAVASGGEHSLALRDDGTVWAWGFNGNGQLGDGTRTHRRTPVRVQGIDSVTAIAAGAGHSVAIKSDGTVWAWGWNGLGSLGNGTTIDRHTPVRVQGLNNAVEISAGYAHTVTRLSNGIIWAWGSNLFGSLGDGTLIDHRTTPVQVQELNNVMTVSAGGEHTVAVRNDGSVWAWGWNEEGQLGTGISNDSHTPVQVLYIGGGTDNYNGSRWYLNLAAPPVPIWSSNTNSIAFPAAVTGYVQQATRSVSITNNGPGMLSGISSSITVGSTAFEIDYSIIPPVGIPQNTTMTIQVRPRTGLSPGTYTGTLRIATTNGNPTHRDIPLSFTVISPPIAWSSSTPLITFLTATVGYSTQAAQSVTINNNGQWALNDVTASITAGSANFQIAQFPSTTVQAGATSTIQVRPVSGLAVGTHTGTLRISSTNGDPAHRDIPLSFTVTPPPVWSINTNSLDFPVANSGYSPQTSQGITITNSGPGTLNNVTVTVGSPNFLITQNPLNNIVADWTSNIQVRPVTGLPPGTYADTLRISSSNGNPAYVEIPLSFTVIHDTEPNDNYGWVTPKFDAIVNRGWLPGDMDGNGIFNSTDVLIARQIGNPSNSRTTASTLAEFPNHDMLYLFNTLRSVDLPDMSERFATIVLEEFMLGDITSTRTFTPTDVLIIRQLANPANARTRACIIADFPVHDIIYLFGALSSLLN